MAGRRQGEENGLTDKINRIIYSAPDGRAAPLHTVRTVHILMGNRSMVGRRTLTPLIKVRILCSSAKLNQALTSFKTGFRALFMIVINL